MNLALQGGIEAERPQEPLGLSSIRGLRLNDFEPRAHNLSVFRIAVRVWHASCRFFTSEATLILRLRLLVGRTVKSWGVRTTHTNGGIQLGNCLTDRCGSLPQVAAVANLLGALRDGLPKPIEVDCLAFHRSYNHRSSSGLRDAKIECA